jgi:hypothetical protein
MTMCAAAPLSVLQILPESLAVVEVREGAIATANVQLIFWGKDGTAKWTSRTRACYGADVRPLRDAKIPEAVAAVKAQRAVVFVGVFFVTNGTNHSISLEQKTLSLLFENCCFFF